jgi:pimeloyl-ACP methyl ester carboxylesterase
MAIQEEKEGSFHFLKSGNGNQAVILLHGNACSKQAFFPLLEKEFPGTILYALDLPGFGKNLNAGAKFSFENAVQHIQQFIALKKLNNIILVGHSMGANIALHLAKKFPSSFKHLFLIAPAGFEVFLEQEKSSVVQSLKNFPSIGIEQTIQFLIPTGFYRKDHPNCIALIQKLQSDYKNSTQQDYLQSCTNGIEEMLGHETFNPQNFPSIKTSILYGDHDPLIPNQLFHTQAPKTFMLNALKGINGVKLFLFKHCGHYVHCEAPEKSASLLLQVIEGGHST